MLFIIVKNPPTSPQQFQTALQNVVQNIYADNTIAQNDALTLANSNPGEIYAVFQLIEIGAAVVPVVPLPQASWIVPTTTDTVV